MSRRRVALSSQLGQEATGDERKLGVDGPSARPPPERGAGRPANPYDPSLIFGPGPDRVGPNQKGSKRGTTPSAPGATRSPSASPSQRRRRRRSPSQSSPPEFVATKMVGAHSPRSSTTPRSLAAAKMAEAHSPRSPPPPRSLAATEMTGAHSPMPSPPAPSARSRSPRRHDEPHRHVRARHLPSHADPLSRLTMLSQSPDIGSEEHEGGYPHLATEERTGDFLTPRLSSMVRSLAAGFGFRTPSTTIGASTSDGFNEDTEMYDVDGDTDNNDGDPFVDHADPFVAQEITNATKRFRSWCWKEFVPIVLDGVVMKGRCKHCDELIGAKRGSGTSALLKHLTRCKKRSQALRIVQDLSSTIRPPNGARLKNWSYEPQAARRELLRMISLHGIPFTFTEYDGFRRFVEALNPMFNVGCRTTARTGCMKDFQQQKLGLKGFFKNLDCRFSLTTDMWTSNQTLGYICITCHFINEEWKLQKRVIKFLDVKTPHTGAELFSNILNCIQDWCIEDKICGITLDNAAANTTMVDLLKRNLLDKNFLLARGQLLHHRCAAHVINLIVKDGLKLVEPIVENIRESVKYIRSSQSRKQKFKEIIAQEGLAGKKQPRLDVPTRWNSTCLMLRTALEFRKVFDSLVEQDPNYTYAPSFDQWERAAVLCDFLDVFNDATNVISGSQYPTSNLYFHELWKIRLVLRKEASEVGDEIAMVLNGMQKKFDKY